MLIAGSAGYGNYRHQADVCHAYQIVLKAGIKPEHIITLAMDDIANSEENPYPGQLFNKPTAEGTPGVDVYDGCQIDYSGKQVTPEIFTAVLTGDEFCGYPTHHARPRRPPAARSSSPPRSRASSSTLSTMAAST